VNSKVIEGCWNVMLESYNWLKCSLIVGLDESKVRVIVNLME